MLVGIGQQILMTRLPQLGLDRGQAVGVDVDQRHLPAVLGEHAGGHPADPGGAAGPGDHAVRSAGNVVGLALAVALDVILCSFSRRCRSDVVLVIGSPCTSDQPRMSARMPRMEARFLPITVTASLPSCSHRNAPRNPTATACPIAAR